MPSTREIRRRIRSVKNISQVTKAMEAVAASKMRRAQNQVLATRPYAKKAQEVLSYIARLKTTEGELDTLITERLEVKRVGILLVTADRGLAGGFNANVIRMAAQFIRKQRQEGIPRILSSPNPSLCGGVVWLWVAHMPSPLPASMWHGTRWKTPPT